MSEKKNGYSHPHGGHRRRLKERFLREGLASFQEHEILELLLFYAIPQRDTNELAHSLVKRFDGLKQVFTADYKKLLECPGISEHSATLLKLIWDMGEWRDRELLPKDLNGADSDVTGKYFVSWFRGKQQESVVALFLDAGGYKIGDAVELVQGSLQHVTVPADKIMDELVLRRASSFILAHNHPDQNLVPSRTDIDTTTRLYRMFGDLGKPLKEHYLVAGNEFVTLISYMQDQLIVQ